MGDEREHGFISPPETMTECCSRYFQAHDELFSFMGSVAYLASSADESVRTLSRVLIKVAETDEEREHYERSIEEGAGVLSRLGTHGQLILQTMLNRAVDNYLAYISELMALIFRTRPENDRPCAGIRFLL